MLIYGSVKQEREITKEGKTRIIVYPIIQTIDQIKKNHIPNNTYLYNGFNGLTFEPALLPSFRGVDSRGGGGGGGGGGAGTFDVCWY